MKPYIKPDPDLPSSPITSAVNSPSKTKTARPWKGEEYQLLLLHAIKSGAPGGDSGWEGVVPGRTGVQSRNAWR